MCGIAGIVRLNGAPVSREDIDAITDSLGHRGPDGRGVWTNGNIGIGHRRLSIIDLSDAASQPMLSSDESLVLTFNGEIYNFAELRTDLEKQGHTFRSHSDTEVLLKLYEVHGASCATMLRGMFAFAIVDTKHRLLFAARDRVGKKPFKYFHKDGVFAFASEWKALKRLPECPRRR